MKKIRTPDELWPWLDRLGDDNRPIYWNNSSRAAFFTWTASSASARILFAEAHAYGAPPSTFHTVEASHDAHTSSRSGETVQLHNLNRNLMQVLGLVRGVTHAEFLKAHATGKIYFLEIAARVGGAYIVDVIEAATGVNLWRDGPARRRCREDSLRIAACGARLRGSNFVPGAAGAPRHIVVR